MPYISQNTRDLVTPVTKDDIEKPGELNFAITTLCNDYLKSHGLSYTNINEIIGVLECAKLELYRRVAAPYEDVMLKANGDVYGS